MPDIGIMQGRLSPPVGGRIQTFPVATWREEFGRAREAGLACIEWIYETGTDRDNPLTTDAGLAEIRLLVRETGVQVWSVCADYYMERRLVGPNGTPVDDTVQHLEWFLGRLGQLGLRHVVLPFVDSSSLKSSEEIVGLRAVLRRALVTAEEVGVELHLETDLKPAVLREILEQVDHRLLKTNYDIGNSASLGHDPVEELTLLAPWLGSVHVKDRLRGGGTVPLGTGGADLLTCFRLFAESRYAGFYLLQAARGPAGKEVALAQEQRLFVERHVAAAAPGRG